MYCSECGRWPTLPQQILFYTTSAHPSNIFGYMILIFWKDHQVQVPLSRVTNHNNQMQRYDCYVMWWWDMGSANMSGAVLPCYHAHDRHDNISSSAPVVSCNGRHNCLTTKPNWPWLAAWLPTVPRKYRCRRGVVWWRDAAAGSRLGSCEGVTQNTHRRRGYTLQILCSPVSVKGLCSSNTLVH